MKCNQEDAARTNSPAISEQNPLSSAIGLDLGDRWSRYCVVNAAGEVVAENRVRSTPEGMAQLFQEMPRMRIVIEAGAHSPWVNRQLRSYGHEVIVANPRKMQMIYESDRKNDRIDARMLARLGRLDLSLLGPIHHRSASAQADLAVVRARDALVAARTRLVNAVRGIVKATGHQLPKSGTSAFANKALPLIPAELKSALLPILHRHFTKDFFATIFARLSGQAGTALPCGHNFSCEFTSLPSTITSKLPPCQGGVLVPGTGACWVSIRVFGRYLNF